MKLLKKMALASTLFALSVPVFAAWPTGKVIAGYMDTTDLKTAPKVDLTQAAKDGYNVVVFAFAKIDGSSINFFSPQTAQQTALDIPKAKAAGMTTLISVGGEGQLNTFNPNTDYQTLATNIVNFLHANKIDGIDFDIETANSITETGLTQLLTDIKKIDSSIIITGAPQVVDGKLTPSYPVINTYIGAAKAGLFNALFIQEYNTGSVQTKPSFISTTFNEIAQQASPTTQIIIGEPTAASAAGADTIYHPSATTTLTTKQATALMLPQLKILSGNAQYGGVMGWSLNEDYARDLYPHNTNVTHIPGEYAYGLKNCVLNGQCDAPPPPKFSNTLQVTDTDSGLNALGVTAYFYLNTPSLSTGYIAPNGKISYQPNDPRLAGLQGNSAVQVNWSTFRPTGSCPAINFSSSNPNLKTNNMIHEFVNVNANVKPVKVICETKYYKEASLPVGQYGLQVKNLGVTGITVNLMTSAFNADPLNPGASKVYAPAQTPALAALEGQEGVVVHWSTPKGQTGICPGSFNFTQNMHVMINPTTKACAFKVLPGA